MTVELLHSPSELKALQYDIPVITDHSIPKQIYNPYPSELKGQGQGQTQGQSPKEVDFTRGEELQDFCRKTTAHGWGRVFYEKHVILKVMWTVLTLTAYCMNAWHISGLVSMYLDFPSEQQMRVEFSQIEFPSVTICNNQPISFSTGLELLQDPSSKLYYWDSLTNSYINLTDNNHQDQDQEVLFNRLKQPLAYFENIGEESLELGHQAHDFILRCTFSNLECSFLNFTIFQSPSYFNCYTFNGGNLSMDKLITKTTGPRQGLSIILYLENDNGDALHNGTYHTLSNIGNSGGARVVVHPTNTRPSPVDHGFDIPPGFSSSVGIRVSKYHRLGKPYGDCIDDIMWGSERYVYSLDTCLTICQQRYISDQCHCISSILPIPETWEDAHKYHYCGFFNASDPDFYFNNLSCEAAKLMEFASNEELRSECGCHPPCLEYSYDNDVSYSYWPLDFTQKSFYQSFVHRHPMRDELKAFKNLERFNSTELITLNLIRKNFLRLNIYLKDLVVDRVEQKKTYELENLFSDLGGTFGLWIGVSVLSLIEIIELFGTLLFKTGKIFKEKLSAEKKVNPDSTTSKVYPF